MKFSSVLMVLAATGLGSATPIDSTAGVGFAAALEGFAAPLVSKDLAVRAAALPAVPASFANEAAAKAYASKLQVFAHNSCKATANPGGCYVCETAAAVAYSAGWATCMIASPAWPVATVCILAAAAIYLNALQACLA